MLSVTENVGVIASPCSLTRAKAGDGRVGGAHLKASVGSGLLGGGGWQVALPGSLLSFPWQILALLGQLQQSVPWLHYEMGWGWRNSDLLLKGQIQEKRKYVLLNLLIDFRERGGCIEGRGKEHQFVVLPSYAVIGCFLCVP